MVREGRRRNRSYCLFPVGDSCALEEKECRPTSKLQVPRRSPALARQRNYGRRNHLTFHRGIDAPIVLAAALLAPARKTGQ
jgi:hypothetical protein